MPDHYYTKNPQSEEKRMTIQATLNGHSFTFHTSTGVFSKKSVDFGTKTLIENFKEPEIDGDILDLGCGYGPIGIALAHKYRTRHITMVDVNERAIKLAKENCVENNVKNVTVLQSDRFIQLENKQFAAIVTNPPIRAGKKVVYALFEESLAHLLPSGELWIVIQRKQGAPSAISFLSSMFTEVETVTKKKGYFIVRAVKG
ncbi:MAG TPA: class I SAM-dependent methyltransferase [Pseudogracilibacillus sp.]|nr:class I SAM-dependent methyltransferase [Pseudogracilibacillus sp.]